ncbi:hypothetical protein D9615_000052 [Tricholomella constricta]|uniref:Reverse transcriptase domain-containing protein n=1 Tax=Tricholomella constricta TaxID=117010 RepID=A0A8H5HS44_9AGAR|nr:hypothetical protein D9615_000052 [Tricholomella constricta]
MDNPAPGPSFELDAVYSPPPLMGTAAEDGYQHELSAHSPQAHLSKGVELIVRGLDRTSPYSAVQHLQRLLEDIGKRSKLPNLGVMQPMREAAPTHPLDYAVVTFQGEYKANPRPDHMSAVGEMIRSVGGGISVGWNIAPGYDKKRMAWFRDDHGIGVGELKRGLESILRSHHYDFQVCTVNAATSPPRVTLQFIDKDHINQLMRQPPVIKGHTFVPRIPRYIEPVYALEVAVVGVATYNDPQMIIDRYLQAKYGRLAKTTLIRSSRLALEDVVYCVVLETPEITEMVVRDPFGAFDGLDIQPSKPEYLYILNQRGFPTQWQRTSGPSSAPDLSTQTQLDGLRSQQDSFQGTLATLANQQQDMVQGFLAAQRDMGTMFGNMLTSISYQTQLSSAQAELTALQLTHNATRMMARLSNSDESAAEMREYANDVQGNPARIPAVAFVQEGASAPNPMPGAALGNTPAQAHAATSPELPSTSQGQPAVHLVPPGLALPPTPSSSEPNPPAPTASSPPPALQNKPKRKHSTKEVQAHSSEGGPKRSRVRKDEHESMDVDDERPQVHSQCASPVRLFHRPSGLGRVMTLGVEVFRLFLGWGPPVLLVALSSMPLLPAIHVAWILPLCLSFHMCATCICISLHPSTPILFQIARPVVLLMLILFLLRPVLATAPLRATAPSNFRIMAANINGFASPVKLNAIRGVIQREAPHVFVLGETKSSTPVSGEFSAPEYQLLDAPGVSTGARHKGKWGLLVGVKRSALTVSRFFTPPHLLGRVLVCDLLLPDSYGRTVQHRVIALYAPWDPGGSEPDTPESFWSAISHLCLEAPFGFSLIGDFNAAPYTRFLHRSGAIDARGSRPDRSWQRDWTFKSFSAASGHHAIIDRFAVSSVGVLTSFVETIPDFIPGTDHRPVIASAVLVPRENLHQPIVPPPIPASDFSPRSYYPRRTDRYRASEFAQTMDQRLADGPSEVFTAEVHNDDDFARLYHAYGQILHDAAHQHFPCPHRPSRIATVVVNPTIRIVLRGIHQLNRLISAIKRGVPWPQERWVQSFLHAYYSQFDEGRLTFSPEHFMSFLRQLRRQLNQCRFHEEKQEAQLRSDRRHMGRVQNLLHGGSAKSFFPPSFSPLPLALLSTADDSLEGLVTGPQCIRETTVQYFEQLYRRTARLPQPKPWMKTPSVRCAAQRVDHDPFSWPQPLSLPDLRQLLKSGNRRPAPGPDGWEKWWLGFLSDGGLSPVLRLLNYMVSRSCIPACLKPVTLTTIHKRGPNTNLSNFRGITCSNLLANLPFAWLNKKLLPYLTSHGIIPPSQVATQPGVQHRDLISLLSQVSMWAAREHIPLFAIQRDQKKGFDMLEPQGFYDALDAYHLPSAISLLDASSQREVPYRVKTAYGLTDIFIVDGVTKQGGSLSPLKCTLTTSLLSHWLSDVSSHRPRSLVLATHQSRTGKPHVPSDSLSVPITMVEAMDDSIIWGTDWPTLLHEARLADRFQTTYGWETAWRKSAVYVFNTDFTPPNQSVVQVPSVPLHDPSSSGTIWNDVPVFRDHVRFLKVPVNRPDLQYLHMRDIIHSFNLPYTRRPLPFTALSRIISQRLVSKLRPCLQLQPIRPSDAAKLDHLIAAKVHQYLGFPFAFSTALFTHPVAARGFGFPSLALLNDTASISGLRRDLCHPIEFFRHVSTITLNDWTCYLNACISPLQYPLSPRSSTRYLSRMPASWIFADDGLYKHALQLHPTDLSSLLSPQLSLVHYANVIDTYRTFPSAPPLPSVSPHLLSRILRRGYFTLGHFGSISISPDFYTPILHVFTPTHIRDAPPISSLSRDWSAFLSWLTCTFRSITTLCPAGPDLLLPPTLRQAVAVRGTPVRALRRSPTVPRHVRSLLTDRDPDPDALTQASVYIFTLLTSCHFPRFPVHIPDQLTSRRRLPSDSIRNPLIIITCHGYHMSLLSHAQYTMESLPSCITLVYSRPPGIWESFTLFSLDSPLPVRLSSALKVALTAE